LIELTYSQKSKKQLRFQNYLFTMKQSLFLTFPEVLMMYRFSSFVLALLLLVASGQAFAAGTCTSGDDGALDGTADDAPWTAEATDGTGCSMTTGNIAAPDSSNVLSIGHDIAAPTAATISVSSVAFTAGSLALTGKTLNVGTTLNAADGTVTIGTDGTLNVTGNVTVGAGGAIDMTGGVLSIGADLDNTAGTLTTGTGTLKLTDAPHAITVAAGKTFSVVDASLLTGATGAGKTITFVGGFDNIISDLILATATATAVEIKFVVPVNQTLTITPSVNTMTCTAAVAGGTAPVAPPTVAGTTTLTLTASTSASTTSTFTCTTGVTTTNAVAAPIFSTKEKAAVFTEEVKH
jgi:hypothetical protein